MFLPREEEQTLVSNRRGQMTTTGAPPMNGGEFGGGFGGGFNVRSDDGFVIPGKYTKKQKSHTEKNYTEKNYTGKHTKSASDKSNMYKTRAWDNHETGNENTYTKPAKFGKPNKSNSKMYTDTANAENLIRKLISDNLENLDSNKTVSDFVGLLDRTTKKTEKADILEKAISYHLWEVLTNERVKKELAEIREGDGYPAMHWISWPAYTAHDGIIEGFNRNELDITKIATLLGESGCDPLSLSGKRSENAFGSLDGSVDLYRNGHAGRKGEYSPGELGVSPAQKQFYTNLFLSIPQFDASAKIMARGVLNTVNNSNINDLRTKFCFVFHANPCIVIQELVKIFYQLSSTSHFGADWPFVRDTVTMCRNMITLGPNFDNLPQKIVAEHLRFVWNSDEQHQIFNDMLATQAVTTADFIDSEIRKIREAKETDEKSSSNVEIFCTESKGAIVGESNVLSFQVDFIVDAINKGNFMQFLYCAHHMSSLTNREILEKILENFSIFETSTKMSLGNIIASKNNWCIKVEGTCGTTPFSKIFNAYLKDADIVRYITSVVNNTSFDPAKFVSDIKVSFSQVTTIKPACVKLEGANSDKTSLEIPNVNIRVHKFGNVVLDTLFNGSTTIELNKKVNDVSANKVDKLVASINRAIQSSLSNVSQKTTSPALPASQTFSQPKSPNKKSPSVVSQLPQLKGSASTSSLTRFSALVYDSDDDIDNDIDIDDDNDINDDNDIDDEIKEIIECPEYSYDLIDKFGKALDGIEEITRDGKILDVIVDDINLIVTNDVENKQTACEYLILTFIAKFDIKKCDTYSSDITKIIEKVFTREEIMRSHSKLSEHMRTISSDFDFAPKVVELIMSKINTTTI